MDWEEYSFVMRSSLRKEILRALEKEPKTPTQLKKELKQSITLVSRYLSQLKKRELIKCLTGKERMWKLYTLTEKGKEVLNEIK